MWLICAVLCLCPQSAWAAEPQVGAEAALLLDMTTGQVLWEHNGYEELPPASTTKVLTALLALDIAPLEREYTVTSQAAAVGESSVGLLAGERFTLGELLDAALLKSANDACYAIAEGAVGSEPFFVRLMNLKADALGLFGAKLQNTNGLPAEEHTLSCYELAMLSREAMRHEEFRSRVGSRYGEMTGGSYNRSLKNTNKLLAMDDSVTGIKTGTTNAAGACLVSSMERDGRGVIAVVLHSPDRYNDSLNLLNYGIDEFQNVRLLSRGGQLGWFEAGGGSLLLPAVTAGDLTVTLPKGAAGLETAYCWRELGELDAVNAGDLLGTLSVTYQGQKLGQINLLAGAAYQPPGWRVQAARLAVALKRILPFGGE